MPNFRPADREAFDLVESLITDHYEDLKEGGVTCGILFAYPTKGVGPALKHHGYAAAAIIKITSKESRAAARQKGQGLPDVVIKVDGNLWETWSEERRCAVLDHELLHIEVQRDKEGVIAEDDQGRPRLKMRLHDFQLEGFASIAERYGAESLEVETARQVVDKFGQCLFPFMEVSG